MHAEHVALVEAAAEKARMEADAKYDSGQGMRDEMARLEEEVSLVLLWTGGGACGCRAERHPPASGLSHARRPSAACASEQGSS